MHVQMVVSITVVDAVQFSDFFKTLLVEPALGVVFTFEFHGLGCRLNLPSTIVSIASPVLQLCTTVMTHMQCLPLFSIDGSEYECPIHQNVHE